MNDVSDVLKVMHLFKLKAEPAEGGAVVSIFVPKDFATLVPGLLLAGRMQAKTQQELEVCSGLEVLGKQILNACAGKHSDEKGEPIET